MQPQQDSSSVPQITVQMPPLSSPQRQRVSSNVFISPLRRPNTPNTPKTKALFAFGEGFTEVIKKFQSFTNLNKKLFDNKVDPFSPARRKPIKRALRFDDGN